LRGGEEDRGRGGIAKARMEGEGEERWEEFAPLLVRGIDALVKN